MPKRTHAEINSDNIHSFFDLILSVSSEMDCSPDFIESLGSVKKRNLSNLLFKEKNQAATEFTLAEAVNEFGLKYEDDPREFRHAWDIEKDMGKEEFPTTPYISETLMPSC